MTDWSEAWALASLKTKHVAKFLYEKVICWYECFQRMMCDDESENKKQIIKLAIHYVIKWIVISSYNSQANEMIEREHQSIVDTLSKLINEYKKKGKNEWVTHLPAVLLADQTTVRASTGMTPFHMLYEYEAVLLIELNVLIWQTLLWNTVQNRTDLLAMQACQIECCDKNMNKARAHLQ